MKIEILPDDFRLSGQKVFFVGGNGKVAKNAVGVAGEDEDGNLMFYEIADDKIARPRISGKEVYCRVFIRRVYPCVEST